VSNNPIQATSQLHSFYEFLHCECLSIAALVDEIGEREEVAVEEEIIRKMNNQISLSPTSLLHYSAISVLKLEILEEIKELLKIMRIQLPIFGNRSA
jgi:hypothetical protein